MRHWFDVVANQSNVLVPNASVSVFVTGTQILAPLFSDDGLTPKANPVITNNMGQFDFFIADGRYDFTVSGSNISTITVSNVEIADITEASQADVPWITENLRFTNQGAVPTSPTPGTIELYTLTSNKHLYMQDETGAITDLTAGSGGGGGGGGLPGAPTNALQKNSGVNTFVASNVVDDGTKVQINSDVLFNGPNPYTDIRRFGVRSNDSRFIPSVPGITATINSGSNVATVSTAACPNQASGICFVNGDGVIIYGAGPAITMSTPGAITVTPSLARSGTGTGDVVSATPASTVYQYQIVARDKNGGLTAASAVGSTATGTASLGSQSVGIASVACSGTTATVTTSSPHNLVPGAHIMITVSSGGNSCLGGFPTNQVVSVPDTTHFTFSQGVSTANGSATSFNGVATVFWMQSNHLSWTAVPGAWQYYIYGRAAGSMVLIGVTHPSAQLNDTTFDDYGPTMMASSTLGIPSYVPTVPPVSSLPDPLVTTITGGAGTTTLTLANPAGTSVTNSTILFTNGPGILKAAANAQNLYWPPTTITVNSFTDVAAVANFGQNAWMYAGGLVLNETLTFQGSWVGDVPNVVTGNASAQFNFMGDPVVATNANPGVFIANSLGFYDRLAFVGGQNPMFIDLPQGVPSGPQFGKHMYFGTAGASDYMGIALYIRGTTGGNGMRAGLLNIQTGPGQQGGGFTGSTFTPAIYIADGGGFFADSIFMQDRGLMYRGDFNSASLHISSGYTQGGIQPFVTVCGLLGNVGGIASGTVEIEHITDDTTFQPILSYLPTALNDIYLAKIGFIDGDPGGGTPIITGPTQNWLLQSEQGTGQNTSAIFGSNFTDNIVTVVGTGRFIYPLSVPPAPTLAASAGGAVPTGAIGYEVTYVDVNNADSAPSAFTPINISPGTQTVTVTAPPIVPGAVGWRAYRCGANGTSCGEVNMNGLGGCSASLPFGTNYVDVSGFGCNNAPVPGGAKNSLSNIGVNAVAINLAGANGPDAPFTNAPRGMFSGQAISLTSTGRIVGMVPDRPITVTAISYTIPPGATTGTGCSSPPQVRVTDGTNLTSLLTLSNSSGSGSLTGLATNYASGADMRLQLDFAGVGCSQNWANVNFVVQYRMQ